MLKECIRVVNIRNNLINGGMKIEDGNKTGIGLMSYFNEAPRSPALSRTGYSGEGE